jgi:phosphoenolpyruvate carboxylase
MMDDADTLSSMTAPPLARDITWLHSRLDEAVDASAHQNIDRVRDAAQRMLVSGTLDPSLADLSMRTIDAILKLLTIRFHLRNKAEQLHITRINREREQAATDEHPRAESLAEAMRTLAKTGVSLDRVLETLAALDIQPTLTAHPTESRRRSVIAKQDRIAELLVARNNGDRTAGQNAGLESEVRQTLSLLIDTDEIRGRRLDVIDEVRNGIHYLGGAIWNAVPGLYRDFTDAIETHYGARVELPVVLRYRTWIGGDRDGNPFVTAERSALALAEMRAVALDRHRQLLEQLHRELSVSERRIDVDPALAESIERDEAEHPLDPAASRHLRHEPFRLKLSHMQLRLRSEIDIAARYTAARYIEDLRTIQAALRHAGLIEVAERGRIADALVAARTFGFHLAALDIRQHSRVHEAAVGEMLALAGVTHDYADLDETARCAVLADELTTARPLLAPGQTVAAPTREILDALGVFAAATNNDPASVGTYIISMAHAVSDLLEVLILLREVGLWTIADGRVECPIDVAPLFETVDDLDHAGDILTAMLHDTAYRKQLAARGDFQEIMLGYSDSNKDGGYWAANWRLHAAQQDLARIARSARVEFRFFHGRGGTVARGGGRANRAILASPPVTRNGRIRFTEQGEVISFRYAMPAVAHRHLEQIVNAMLLATAGADVAASDAPSEVDDLAELMNDLAAHSRRAYRNLIDDERFWPLFIDRSPVLHIGELPIASRPVSRAGSDVTFENLRAIPWVFAWTQMRYNAPGWFGIGSAFEELVMHDQDRLMRCRNAYKAGGYIRAFIDNAQQELARARLDVAGWYMDASGREFHQRLKQEFELAERAVLGITGQTALLDNNPVIQQSIRERNGDTDVINALQVELLRRWRTRDGAANNDALNTLILLSVNALAAAMQSTG